MLYIYIYIYIYVCMYVCLHVCMYVCIYIFFLCVFDSASLPFKSKLWLLRRRRHSPRDFEVSDA